MAFASSSSGAVLNLFIHAPAALVSSERRLPSTIPLDQLRGHLERLTGIPPDQQRLSLWTTRTDDPDARATLVSQLTDDDKSLEQYGVRELMCIKVSTN